MLLVSTLATRARIEMRAARGNLKPRAIAETPRL